MNLLDDNNTDINNFLTANQLVNHIKEPTRVTTTSATLIDVILHNDNLVLNTAVIDCPFSDHSFTAANIVFNSNQYNSTQQTTLSRCLTTSKLDTINLHTDSLDFNLLNSISSTDTRWLSLKQSMINILQHFAPLKQIKLHSNNSTPWFDYDLCQLQAARDKAYKRFKRTSSQSDKDTFAQLKSSFQQLRKHKMIDYFKNKKINDFNSNKKFWEFYSTHIRLRSDKSNGQAPSSIHNGNITANQPKQISNLFNQFFCSLSSNSTTTTTESSQFIEHHFDNIITNHDIKPDTFQFRHVTHLIVKRTFDSLDTASGPGLPSLPTKLFKPCPHSLLLAITQLYNDCIDTSCIPLDWKSALVTALHKGKGLSIEDVNNYRSIAVLPPIAKAFEKIITSQITIYFNINKLLYTGQHGFRTSHSCETALHEIITDMLNILGKRHIGLFLFIDFRKAFDLINPQLLLIKLRRYGFDPSALNLMSNYFTDRHQTVKHNNHLSSSLPIKLGVPQGSVLGPLLFIIFINDLPFFASDLNQKLFADDTTAHVSRDSYDLLISDFNIHINHLITWCRFNQLDINWTKTKAMFITKKMDPSSNRPIDLPKFIRIGSVDVEVVHNFRLLGVTIDDKLNFLTHTSNIRRSVNIRLYSIHKLFYLPFQVKLQFFKTFILPHFDYCSTLLIYFSKRAIQRLADSYFICIHKLFNISKYIATSNDYNLLNNTLESFNISCFQHRLITRFSDFIYKILNNSSSPSFLRKHLVKNNSLVNQQVLRNADHFKVPASSKLNHHDDFRFPIFFARFCNLLLLPYLSLPIAHFKLSIYNNINRFFPLLVQTFPKFDINYCIRAHP